MNIVIFACSAKSSSLSKTILHFAAATKSTESNIIEHILSKLEESLVNVQNFNNQSPLHIAILHNHENVVHKLIAAGKNKYETY